MADLTQINDVVQLEAAMKSTKEKLEKHKQKVYNVIKHEQYHDNINFFSLVYCITSWQAAMQL